MLFRSALNNPEDYTAALDAGYLDFAFVLKRGDELLDMFTFLNMLVFFFRDHIAIFSGSNPTASGDFALQQLIEGCGVVGTDTVQGLGTDCAFLYNSGVKSLRQVVTTGALNLNDVSEHIDPVIMPDIAGNAGGRWASAHYPKMRCYFILIGNTVWGYSYTWKAWFRMVGTD